MRPASLPIPRQNAAHHARPMLRLVDSGRRPRPFPGTNMRGVSQCIRRRDEAHDFFLSREINRTVMNGFHPALPSRA
jgi:hypothetical protein